MRGILKETYCKIRDIIIVHGHGIVGGFIILFFLFVIINLITLICLYFSFGYNNILYIIGGDILVTFVMILFSRGGGYIGCCSSSGYHYPHNLIGLGSYEFCTKCHEVWLDTECYWYSNREPVYPTKKIEELKKQYPKKKAPKTVSYIIFTYLLLIWIGLLVMFVFSFLSPHFEGYLGKIICFFITLYIVLLIILTLSKLPKP